MTLLELLTAEAIGAVVVTAAIMLVIVALNSSSRVTDRVSSAQNGRGAMEQIQQRLRSQTCLYPLEYMLDGDFYVVDADESDFIIGKKKRGKKKNPYIQNEVYIGAPQSSFVHASGNKMIFFADIGNGTGASSITGSTTYRPQMRFLEIITDATGRRDRIVEGWRDSEQPSPAAPGTLDTTVPFNFNVNMAEDLWDFAPLVSSGSLAPVSRRVIAEGVTAVTPGVPYFQFYDANGVPSAYGPTSGAVDDINLASIGRVHIGFKFVAESGKVENDARTASFENDVNVRASSDRCR